MDNYHLLVAQNFLSSIGKPCDTEDIKHILHWNNRKIAEQENLENENVSNEVGAVRFVLEPATVETASVSEFFSLEPGNKTTRLSHQSISEDGNLLHHSTHHHHHAEKKPSFLKKFVKILSSDDVVRSKISREEDSKTSSYELRQFSEPGISEDDRPASPLSSSFSNFQFFRKFRTSAGNKESEKSCSPFAVISHLVFSKEKDSLPGNPASFPTLSTSMDRARHVAHCSVDELKPYDFSDDEDTSEVSFGHLINRRRRLTPSGTIFKRERRESQYIGSVLDLVDDVVDNNCDTEEVAWVETTENYDPAVFDVIESCGKTVVRADGFVCVSHNFNGNDGRKSTQNALFSEKFPQIALSYSKFKSIKREMLTVGQGCSIDLATISQSYVFFERVVIKGLISKSNRKPVAGACMLVAAKLNDYNKEQVKLLIQNITDSFRISRKDLLSFELPVCAALQFELSLRDDSFMHHYYNLVIGFHA